MTNSKSVTALLNVVCDEWKEIKSTRKTDELQAVNKNFWSFSFEDDFVINTKPEKTLLCVIVETGQAGM